MTRRRTPLEPVEVATAGILTGLAVALGLLASISPLFPLVFQVGAVIPIAMLASRLRPRAGISAALVSVLLATAFGGIPTAYLLLQTSTIGLVVGFLHRKNANALSVGATAAAIGLLGAGITLGVFTLFASARELALESTRTAMTGYLKLLGKWKPLSGPAASATAWVDAFIAAWRIWLPTLAGLGLVVLLLSAYWLLGKVLARLDFARQWDPLAASARAEQSEAPPAPLPVSLRGVNFTYPGSSRAALEGIDLDIDDGFTAILGPNGSGKSTLALVLAGAEPSGGTVTRAGAHGLGRHGGTAFLAQRSEIQFLGATVAEDVVWGLHEDERAQVDVSELLELVGLNGKEHTLTRRLSGGQLQRLALAGALARKPALLVSDESTAMIDTQGRADILDILAALPARGTAVVHITHDPIEAARAQRIVRLEDGKILSDSPCVPSVAPREVAPTVTSEYTAHVGDTQHSSASPLALSHLGARSSIDKEKSPLRPLEIQPFESGGRSVSPVEVQEIPTLIAPEFMPPVERLWAQGISHTYDSRTPWEHKVLTEVTFIVSPASALLITGENGSGKSTLARIMTGLMAPSSGKCTLGGDPVTQRIGDVALARQFARLQLQRPTVGLDILSAAGYGPSVGSGHGRKNDALDPDEAQQIVAYALAEVGLDASLSHRGIDELSGGQMRRVALAGILASNPPILVLDEPMAGLDDQSRTILLDVLAKRKQAGLGIVVISHDIAGFDALCDEHLHLDQGVVV